MFCPKCGNLCDDNATFCNSCGAPLSAQPGNQSYQQPNYQQPNYQQPGYPGGMNGGYRVAIKNRSIGMCILLSIITCRIYGIYWMICMADDLNIASERPGDTSGGMVFFLTLVTCGIYGLYWLYKAGEKVGYIKARNTGIQSSSDGVLYLVLGIFGLSIVSYCLIQSELNNVAALQ